jgi:hypothetical protein
VIATIMPRGNTETAQYLDRTSPTAGTHFRSSIAFGNQSVYSELATVWNECKTPDWDGYDALAVKEATLRNAYCFVKALPLGCLPPSVGAEPDGHMTLEWYRHPRWTLSVSISPEGTLYYAALFGNSDARGSESFFGEIPKAILQLIQRVSLHA